MTPITPLDKARSAELQEYADIACEMYGIKPVRVHVKNIQGGRAIYRTRFISVPRWAYTKEGLPEEYPLYYLLHEVAHFIDHDTLPRRRDVGHDSTFKIVEQCLLKKAGIYITYKKAYPATLTANGQTHKC
jgi:hypothetical protein